MTVLAGRGRDGHLPGGWSRKGLGSSCLVFPERLSAWGGGQAPGAPALTEQLSWHRGDSPHTPGCLPGPVPGGGSWQGLATSQGRRGRGTPGWEPEEALRARPPVPGRAGEEPWPLHAALLPLWLLWCPPHLTPNVSTMETGKSWAQEHPEAWEAGGCQEPRWPLAREVLPPRRGLRGSWGGCWTASVLQDGLVGLVHVLGHLRSSALQGQL